MESILFHVGGLVIKGTAVIDRFLKPFFHSTGSPEGKQAATLRNKKQKVCDGFVFRGPNKFGKLSSAGGRDQAGCAG